MCKNRFGRKINRRQPIFSPSAIGSKSFASPLSPIPRKWRQPSFITRHERRRVCACVCDRWRATLNSRIVTSWKPEGKERNRWADGLPARQKLDAGQQRDKTPFASRIFRLLPTREFGFHPRLKMSIDSAIYLTLCRRRNPSRKTREGGD